MKKNHFFILFTEYFKNNYFFVLVLTICVLSYYSPYLFINNWELSVFDKYKYHIYIDILLYLVIPLLIILKISNLKSYGFSIGDYKSGLKYVLISIPFLIFISWIASANYSSSIVTEIYPKNNFIYYFILQAIYVFAWEFFIRGYILNELKKYTNYYLMLHLFPFVLMHLGKSFNETILSIPGGIILGLLAIRTNSFIYGFLIHYLLILLVDVFLIFRDLTGNYSISLNSFFNIFWYWFLEE